MSTAKPSARFLPTLAEVVQLIPAEPQPPKASAPRAASLDPVLELTQRAMVLLEARMAERMEALVKVQAQNVLEGLRDEMHAAVADAVKQALREGE